MIEANSLTFFQMLLLGVGGGIIFTGGGILILLGRKLQIIEDIKEEMDELRNEVALRPFCKERHLVIDKRLDEGDKRFIQISKDITDIKIMLERIDERTAKEKR